MKAVQDEWAVRQSSQGSMKMVHNDIFPASPAKGIKLMYLGEAWTW